MMIACLSDRLIDMLIDIDGMFLNIDNQTISKVITDENVKRY